MNGPDKIRRLVGESKPHRPPQPHAEFFRAVDMTGLRSAEDAPQRWLWDRRIPAGHVTLLGGHGGAGKSTFALQLGACVATGQRAFDRDTEQARVLFFSGEDPAPLVLARLRRICDRLGLDVEQVQENLQVIDASDLQPVLFAERRMDGVRHGVTTETYEALRDYVKAHGFRLVIVDNASDAFDADEIARSLVRAFMRSLAQLTREDDGAVLLLAHVDKMTAKMAKQPGSEGYSGSTAWHNSARSRMLLVENEPGLLELLHQKCNLAPKLPPLLLRWPEGDVMRADEPLSPVVAGIQSRNEVKALLSLLHEYTERGEFIAAGTTSPENAHRLLSGNPKFPRDMKAKDVFEHLRDAERSGLIVREQYRTLQRKDKERWVLTDKGRISIGAPTAPTAPTTQDGTQDADGAEVAPTAPTSQQGVWGGVERTEVDAEGVQP